MSKFIESSISVKVEKTDRPASKHMFSSPCSGDSLLKKILVNRAKNKNLSEHIQTDSNIISKVFSHVHSGSNCNTNSFFNQNLNINGHCNRSGNNTIRIQTCKRRINNESMFNKNLLDNPCGSNCKNLQLMRQCETKLKELMESNDQLKKVNEYLMLTINRKEDMYINLQKENIGMKSTIQELKNYIKIKDGSNFEKGRGITQSDIRKIIDTKSNEKQCSTRNSSLKKNQRSDGKVNEIITVSPTTIKSGQKISIKTQKTLKRQNTRTSKLGSSLGKTVSHYERIYELSGRNLKRKCKGDSKISLLALTDDIIKKIIANEFMCEVYDMTLSDEDFIEIMRNTAEEKLVAFSDIVGSAIKDYQNALRLFLRIKRFLKSNVSLVKSVLMEESTACLVKNACDILECERTTLFVHDKISDKLVVHSGEGLKKSELKIPKDKGIVGISFQKGITVKVDEPYSDSRFNKEIDKATGFKTRNILCLPLRDHDGGVFGVIQSVNKIGGIFNSDDEELMEIFSAQASAILKNSMNFDEDSKYTSRLKMIIQFSVQLDDVIEASQFTLLAEGFLMSLFSSNAATILIFDKSKDCLCHLTNFHTEKKKKVGIVNHVLVNKQFFGCVSVDDSEIYNNLTDLETGLSLLTYPIFKIKDKSQVLAVAQFAYPDKLIPDLNKPKELQMDIIDLFLNFCSIWMSKYFLNDNN